jgi:glyoxylase-like metal-dependent hydrolase (beta-lactamase superfamily II)
LTHAHIDHVFGLQWAFDTFKVPVNMHQEDQEVLDMLQASGVRFGMQVDPVKVDIEYVKEGDELNWMEKNLKFIMFRDILREV